MFLQCQWLIWLFWLLKCFKFPIFSQLSRCVAKRQSSKPSESSCTQGSERVKLQVGKNTCKIRKTLFSHFFCWRHSSGIPQQLLKSSRTWALPCVSPKVPGWQFNWLFGRLNHGLNHGLNHFTVLGDDLCHDLGGQITYWTLRRRGTVKITRAES